MRILLAILVTVALFSAVDAQAWCVKCEGRDCWMTWNAGAVRCASYGTACMTSGSCEEGTEGCPDPDGCIDPVEKMRLDSPCKTMLADVWRLEAVEVSRPAAPAPVAAVAVADTTL